ncbi:MAG: beta-glucuronidase [Anaerolineae bacterium]|nr:beta-glucuronidase [Anaerolineae bacterium]
MLYPIQNEVRNTLDLSGIWDFQTDPNEVGEQDQWFNSLPDARPIAVPGSWNEQYADIYNYTDRSWYLKRTYIPSSWKNERIFLRVGSANYSGTVYINGIKVGEHKGGHLPFAFDVTGHVQWNQANMVAISVENYLIQDRVPPGGAGPLGVSGFPGTPYDFFPFAGLHRPVVLYSVPATHIEDVTVVTEIDGQTGVVKVAVKLSGGDGQGQVVLTGAGQRVEAALSLATGAGEVTLRVPSARLWSPGDPYLYDLDIITASDHYSLPIGIRTIAVQGKQVLLNGQPVTLNGFGRHEDFIASGKGLNLPLLIKDYQLMRWVGATSYRTSHYPYSEEEMQLADREGFLIIDEIPAVSLQFETPELLPIHLRECLRAIDELIARDKNHPSVIMWSVANEPIPQNPRARFAGWRPAPGTDDAGKQFLDTLVQRARDLDPTRLVTVVGLMGAPNEWLKSSDVVCVNRYWGWYTDGGELETGIRRMDEEFDLLWQELGRPIIVTEFGADTVAGLHGEPAVMFSEEYQANFIRGYLATAAKKDFVVGMQVWNFADFAAVQGINRVGGLNLKGIFTRTRQPKMAAQVLREYWRQ